MAFNVLNKQLCYGCRKYFFKKELKIGKSRKLFCENCITKEENLSLKQIQLNQVCENVLKKIGSGLNE